MESKSLIEIGNRLAMLPALKERLDKLCIRINESKKDVQALLHKFEAESLDVEQMKKDSLSTTILKLVGKYEGKFNKETEQMLAAKIEYDKAADKVKELQLQSDELINRLSVINQEQQTYEAEFNKRIEIIKLDINSEASKEYRQLESEQNILSRQLVETDEALSAANRVISTANSASQQLDSAENWATYDVWVKGGILGHMAKYEHIDNAQADFNRLNLQMESLQKELVDVNLSEVAVFSEIDSTTRAIDFWFDNIFTDWNVRNKIRDDKDRLTMLYDKIYDVIKTLEGNKTKIDITLKEIEARKNDLIISG